jgi:hypothetical protein
MRQKLESVLFEDDCLLGCSCHVEISAWKRVSLNVFRDFNQSIEESFEVVPEMKPQQLPF